MNATDTGYKIMPKAVTSGPQHHFFGYYDKFPWDKSGRFMLAMEVDFIDHLPGPDELATIGTIDLLDDNKFRPIAQTSAWNWQQGCMLQWLGPDCDRYIIYNERADDKFVSIVVDIKSGEKKTMPMAVYSVTPDGRYAITLNFSRLHHVRCGYGYAGLDDLYYDQAASDKDGIYLLDLETGRSRLILSLAQLYKYNHISSMEGGNHWVNHIMCNTDGSRFAFLHRWPLPDGGMYTRLLTSNLDGTDLFCLLDSGNFSHYGWRCPKEIVGWGRCPGVASKLRKHKWLSKNIVKHMLPAYHAVFSNKNPVILKLVNDGYWLLEDETGKIKRVGSGLFNQDGHCSWSPDGKWLLTDTYPDQDYQRTLILYNYEKNLRIDVGKFYSLPAKRYSKDTDWSLSPLRSDLHPRWNRDGTKVCIDSVHEGSRQIYVLDVKKIIGGN